MNGSSHLGVCTVLPRWPLWHWPESLKSLLHMSVKQEWHRLRKRDWHCEHWKIKSRLTVWKVKMRLVGGFCGHFAKSPFSSLSIKKLEVIEVRELVYVLDSWVLIAVLLPRSVHLVKHLNPAVWWWLTNSIVITRIAFAPHFCSFLQLHHSFFSSYAFKERMAVKQAAGFNERREERNVGS